MVVLKTVQEIEKMKLAGKISARALKLAGEMVEPGVSTGKIDEAVSKYIKSQGAASSTLGYSGFPKSCCISVNNEIIHGIPSNSCILKSGDIVSIDISANIGGYHGDNAYTFACGDIGENVRKLINATKESLQKAISVAKVGNRLGDVGNTVEEYVKERGYSVVRDFVGHGVGTSLHEDPSVPNYGKPGHGLRLREGMTIAIEPMVNEGTSEFITLDDGWTIITADKKLSAHFEHTVAITSSGPLILTDPT
ncbi:MAG: type I methionyl aminopeptidase [Clostridia bacterium]|nr:type I methionyl aminopeptidase [Clostridia bacterium]